jgi:hypothetical protein
MTGGVHELSIFRAEGSDLAKSRGDRFRAVLASSAAGASLRVREGPQFARTRADFERFSAMSEKRETDGGAEGI